MIKRALNYFALLTLLVLSNISADSSSDPPQSIPSGFNAGPDIIAGNMANLQQFGAAGTQRGLATAITSCNAGNQVVGFFAMPNTDHPAVAQNLYRMSGGTSNNERFEQIGQSWVKHTYGAKQANSCNFGCQPGGDFTHLGVGCSDTYFASQSAVQADLGSRAWINPFTGVFPTTARDHTGHNHTAVSHMMVVESDDLNQTINSGATYYSELVYVTPDEYAWCQAHPGECNMFNNASYLQYSVSGVTNFNFSQVGSPVRMMPAFNAWTGATIKTIEPEPGVDGRAFLAYKVTGPVGGLYHYEYAIYNLNLDRGIQSFSVPRLLVPSAPEGIGPEQNVGFHGPPQHPGFPNDGTQGDTGFSAAEWTFNENGLTLTWNSETVTQNPNANAIRWGTLYNFRFDSISQPVTANATIGFFKTGAPITVEIQGPAPFGVHFPTPTPTPTPACTPTGPKPPTPTPGPPAPTPSPAPTPVFDHCSWGIYYRESFDAVTPPALPSGWNTSFVQGPADCSGGGTCASGTHWMTDTNAPYTSPNIAFHDSPGCVTDSNLDSRPIVIAAPPFFTGGHMWLWHNFDFENGFDGGVLEVSVDGGPFTDIVAAGGQFVRGGYNGTIACGYSNPLAGRPAWTGNSNGYLQTELDLDGLVSGGETVVFRFRLATDCSNEGGGWRIDNLTLGVMVKCQPSPTPTPGPPSPSPTPLPTGTPLPTPCGVIFSENFDGVTAPSLPTSWVTAAASGIGPWQTSTDNAPSGPNDAMAYESLAAGETVLETPAIAVPAGGGILSFQNHFNLLANPPPSQGWNGMVLDIRINAGAYDDIITAGGAFLDGGYTHTIGCCFGNPLTGRMAWSGYSGNSASYITTTVALPAAANGQNIKMKWRLGTIGFPSGGIPPSGEIRIDSIVIIPASCPTPTPCPACTPTPTPSAGETHAQNLSTRLFVQTGADAGIGGFIITGDDPKQVLLRGIGPSLGSSGVSNPLADPLLELHGPTGFATVTNNNWRDTQEAEIMATGIAPTNDLESAILMMLDPGSYTAILKGNNDGVGVGLVEIYDLSQGSASKLGNLSTRAFASTGSDIVITGFILGGGTNEDTVLLRGLGPSLIASGVTNALANPTLELRNGDGAVVAMNDDWRNGSPVSLPPSDSLESAIEATLSPGAYTALLSGVNNGTGVGLVEVYDRGVPSP